MVEEIANAKILHFSLNKYNVGDVVLIYVCAP
jgi:hypothetical protein